VTLTFTDTSIRVQSSPDFQTTSLGADYPVYFDVWDGHAAPVRMAIYVNVTNTLDAPRATTLTVSVSCDEDTICPTTDLYSIFYDPDDPLRRAPLNFLVSSNGEIGYTISAGRTLILNLPRDYSGAKTIQLQAVKFVAGQPYSSEIVELTLIVREVNDPPRVNSVSPPGAVTVQEGGSKSFSIDAVDPEHLPLTYDWFLDGVNLQNTLATFAYAPNFNVAHAGGSQVVHLRVVANDSQGGLAEFEWEVTVVDVPHPPAVTISAPMEGNRGYHVGVPLTFFASAYDPDGDVLSYEWKDSGGQVLLTTANGTLVFRDSGTQKITLKVSDGVLSVTTSVNVTVDPAVNGKPFVPGFEGPTLIGALAIAAAAAVVARRRRGA